MAKGRYFDRAGGAYTAVNAGARSRNERKPPVKLQFYGQFFLTPYRSVNGLTTGAIWRNLKKARNMGGFSNFRIFLIFFENQNKQES